MPQNLGRDRIIRALHEAGATDHRSAWGRAVLQGKIETAKLLRTMLGNPIMPDDGLGGPASKALCMRLASEHAFTMTTASSLHPLM
ncbi:MAG: hypothetical protein ABI693_27500 [Bryobacteraceae bacterium]